MQGRNRPGLVWSMYIRLSHIRWTSPPRSLKDLKLTLIQVPSSHFPPSPQTAQTQTHSQTHLHLHPHLQPQTHPHSHSQSQTQNQSHLHPHPKFHPAVHHPGPNHPSYATHASSAYPNHLTNMHTQPPPSDPILNGHLHPSPLQASPSLASGSHSYPIPNGHTSSYTPSQVKNPNGVNHEADSSHEHHEHEHHEQHDSKPPHVSQVPNVPNDSKLLYTPDTIEVSSAWYRPWEGWKGHYDEDEDEELKSSRNLR
ncbi:hypothetical protein FB446DRAFT_199390 [Lentinula raphanica]|nr:hypothetical protein FB446DRAFT_199390 [Lentinula raphanica]